MVIKRLACRSRAPAKLSESLQIQAIGARRLRLAHGRIFLLDYMDKLGAFRRPALEAATQWRDPRAFRPRV
jgi:hypothetical protein